MKGYTDGWILATIRKTGTMTLWLNVHVCVAFVFVSEAHDNFKLDPNSPEPKASWSRTHLNAGS